MPQNQLPIKPSELQNPEYKVDCWSIVVSNVLALPYINHLQSRHHAMPCNHVHVQARFAKCTCRRRLFQLFDQSKVGGNAHRPEGLGKAASAPYLPRAIRGLMCGDTASGRQFIQMLEPIDSIPPMGGLGRFYSCAAEIADGPPETLEQKSVPQWW